MADVKERRYELEVMGSADDRNCIREDALDGRCKSYEATSGGLALVC